MNCNEPASLLLGHCVNPWCDMQLAGGSIIHPVEKREVLPEGTWFKRELEAVTTGEVASIHRTGCGEKSGQSGSLKG